MSKDFPAKFSFSAANRFALGVEEQVWTVHVGSGVPFAVAPQIFRGAYRQDFPRLRPELPAQMIASVTPSCRTIQEVHESLDRNVAALRELGREYRFAISRDPVPRKPYLVQVYPDPRFRQIAADVGSRLRGAFIASMRVHVGVASMDEGLRALRVLRMYLPQLLAISARSPRRVGRDDFTSFRYAKYREMAQHVVPPVMRDEKDFTIAAVTQGFAVDPLRCGWGVRLNPLGTVELRICDVQTRRATTLGIAALVRIVVRAAVEGTIAAEPVSPGAIEDQLFAAATGKVLPAPLIKKAHDLAHAMRAVEESIYIRRLLP